MGHKGWPAVVSALLAEIGGSALGLRQVHRLSRMALIA
jgi:hypothetical protein